MTRFCPSCGSGIIPGSAYCSECGAVAGRPDAGTHGPAGFASPAARPAASPSPGVPSWLLVVLLVVVVSAGAGVTVAYLTAGQDQSVAAGTVAAPPAPAGSGSVAPVPAPSDDPPPAPDDPPAPVRTSSEREAATPYYTVIVASKSEAEGGRDEAQRFARRLEDAGFSADVFHSSNHSSLRPGYWVAATGRHSSSSSADSLSRDVSAAGFDIAYPRCVGTASEC